MSAQGNALGKWVLPEFPSPKGAALTIARRTEFSRILLRVPDRESRAAPLGLGSVLSQRSQGFTLG